MPTEFMKEAAASGLAELRAECALARQLLHQSRTVHWGWWPNAERERYTAIRNYQVRVRTLERALQQFIREHSDFLEVSGHGRLCWNSFLGGYPIDRHYCQLPEGHFGFHTDDAIYWFERTEDGKSSSQGE